MHKAHLDYDKRYGMLEQIRQTVDELEAEEERAKKQELATAEKKRKEAAREAVRGEELRPARSPTDVKRHALDKYDGVGAGDAAGLP